MKTPKVIYIVSPKEPCGVTWLINCLLIVKIKCYPMRPFQMWESLGDNRFKLIQENDNLKMWLPALSEYDEFVFRDDIEICWTHEWPSEATSKSKIIYFIRDPRDALFSRYRRENHHLKYAEYADILDPVLLLNAVDYWKLFNTFWLNHKDLKVFRFEDYKQDSRKVLDDVLKWCSVVAVEDEILLALESSTPERAQIAETAYSSRHENVGQVINQGGIIGRWKNNLDETEKVSILLEKKCGLILERLGYELKLCSEFSPVDSTTIPLVVRYIAFFHRLAKLQGFDIEEKFVFDSVPIIDRYVQNLNSEDFQRNNYSAVELANSLISFEDVINGILLDAKTQMLKTTEVDRFKLNLALKRSSLRNFVSLSPSYMVRFIYYKLFKR